MNLETPTAKVKWYWLAALVGLSSACGGGVDILADGERENDPLNQRVVTTTSSLEPTPTPLATPTPVAPRVIDPAATPTGLPGPTARPTASLAPTPTATPTPLPAPAAIRAPAVVRANVGESVETGILTSSSPNNPIESVRIEDGPPGLSDANQFAPTAPGLWQATVVVTDSFDRETRRTVKFLSRYPTRANAVLAIGDSIASGHGLQLTDYLGRDDCFRSDEGYPGRVVDSLVRADRLPADTQLGLVACSGHDAGDLSTKLVTGGIPGTEPTDGSGRTQLDWVAQANPALVFVSVGINDLGFVDPVRLIVNGQLDDGLVEPRLAQLQTRLAGALDQILSSTDATVVVTGYYNPTAENPQGVEGCETACFVAISEDAVERLNTTIVAALPASDRVVFVDLADQFVGHGAPNGVGPDGARAGAGVVGDLFSGYFEGIQPYCAKGETRGDPWVNAIDCVHPTNDGVKAIADAVLAALDSF